jgi:hypothetical protein
VGGILDCRGARAPRNDESESKSFLVLFFKKELLSFFLRSFETYSARRVGGYCMGGVGARCYAVRCAGARAVVRLLRLAAAQALVPKSPERRPGTHRSASSAGQWRPSPVGVISMLASWSGEAACRP